MLTSRVLVLQRVGGKDASKQFWKYHNESILKKYKPKLQVGSLDSKKQAEPKAAPAPKKEEPKAAPSSTEVKKFTKREPVEPLEPFGDLIPYADPSWYQTVSHIPHDAKVQGRD
jgi:hypothetical protein